MALGHRGYLGTRTLASGCHLSVQRGLRCCELACSPHRARTHHCMYGMGGFGQPVLHATSCDSDIRNPCLLNTPWCTGMVVCFSLEHLLHQFLQHDEKGRTGGAWLLSKWYQSEACHFFVLDGSLFAAHCMFWCAFVNELRRRRECSMCRVSSPWERMMAMTGLLILYWEFLCALALFCGALSLLLNTPWCTAEGADKRVQL